MKKRVFRGVFFVALAVAACCVALVLGVLYAHFSAQQRAALRQEIALAAPAVETEGLSYLEGLSLGKTRLTWLTAEGRVLFDSRADGSAMENHLSRPEIQEALSDGAGESTRESGTLLERTTYYAKRLKDGTVLRASASQYTWVTLLVNMLQPLLILLAAATALAALLAGRISGDIARPLAELDFSHPEQANTYEELTPLLSRLAAQNREIAGRIEELTRQQEEFSLITRTMAEGLIVIGSRTDILSCNESALRLLGVSGAQIGESVLTLNRSEEFRAAVESALGGQFREETLRLHGRACALLASPAGEGGALLLLMDVTEKEERERLRREFTANVSHELKTPLTSISGYAEIIENGVAAPKDIPRFAGQIRAEAARMIALVGDILRLSRLEERTLENQTEVSLLSLLKEARQALAPVAEAKQISLQVEGEELFILGERETLYEMILNLMDNAVKYNRPGGSVRAQLTAAEMKILLRIEDTGPGIPDGEKERVFERFYRVDKSRSRQVGGTGLGLSIAKHAALLHHGRITLSDTPGGGTTVTVVFPQ